MDGRNDALMERTDEPLRLWTDEVTLWRNGDPAELARALRIYWRTWLCQLGMTDDNLTIDVITTALQKDETTDAQSMRSEWNQPPRPMMELRTILMRRKRRCEQIKEQMRRRKPVTVLDVRWWWAETRRQWLRKTRQRCRRDGMWQSVKIWVSCLNVG